MKTEFDFKQFMKEVLDQTSIRSCSIHKAYDLIYVGRINGANVSVCFQSHVKNHIQRNVLSVADSLPVLVEHNIKSGDLLFIEKQLQEELEKNTHENSVFPFLYRAKNVCK